MYRAPPEEAPARIQKRFDREAALVHLQHALFVQKSLFLTAIDSNHGPIRLLPIEVLRVRSPGCIVGDGLEKSVRIRRKLERLNRHGHDAETLIPAAPLEQEPDVTALGVRHVHIIPAAAPRGGGEGGCPLLSVVRLFHPVGGRVVLRVPVDDQTAMLADLEEVDEQPLLFFRRKTLPGRLRIFVENLFRLVTRKRRRSLHLCRPLITAGPLALLEMQVVDPYRSLAAGSRGNCEFDCSNLFQGAVGTPSVLDSCLTNGHSLPLDRKHEVPLFSPPHALSGGIHELEFEVVLRRGRS